MSGTILVTPRSITRAGGHPTLRRLEEAGFTLRYSCPGESPSEEELLSLLPGSIGYLAGVERVSARVLEAASPALRVISRNGAGVSNIDAAACARLGIRICSTPGANARGVAELTLGLILSLLRAIPASDAVLKAGGWQRREGRELAGRSLGLLGCGSVGRQVTALATAVGMRVAGYDARPDLAFGLPGFRWVGGLEELLVGSEVLSLHCPPAADGRPILDRAALARLPAGAYLVNTARAEVVEEAAVLEALESGRLSGYATDVYPEEPPAERTLLRHPRVIATPHIGAYTAESVARAVEAAVDNLLRELGGKE